MGARESFTTMYRREGEPVLRFLARRTLDAALAADLTAETFALAFRSWSRLAERSEDEVRAWLYTVARRQVSRYLRRGRVEQRAVQRLGIAMPALHEDDVNLVIPWATSLVNRLASQDPAAIVISQGVGPAQPGEAAAGGCPCTPPSGSPDASRPYPRRQGWRGPDGSTTCSARPAVRPVRPPLAIGTRLRRPGSPTCCWRDP